MTLVLDRAEGVSGWMETLELAWLAEQAQLYSRIVELGSYLGRSTRVLGDNTPGWVLAFDDWKGVRDSTVPPEVKDMLEDDSLYPQFMENVKDLIECGKVKVLQGNHADISCIPVEFLYGPQTDKPDMVFIDGTHDYEDVRRDILVWKHRLAEGGLLCGHDINMDGVLEAVQELIPRWEQIPLTYIWRAIA